MGCQEIHDDEHVWDSGCSRAFVTAARWNKMHSMAEKDRVASSDCIVRNAVGERRGLPPLHTTYYGHVKIVKS